MLLMYSKKVMYPDSIESHMIAGKSAVVVRPPDLYVKAFCAGLDAVYIHGERPWETRAAVIAPFLCCSTMHRQGLSFGASILLPEYHGIGRGKPMDAAADAVRYVLLTLSNQSVLMGIHLAMRP